MNDKLQQITERVNRFGNPDEPSTPRPLLTLEEFFEGNECVGSIGCNLEDAPHPEVFHQLFKQFLSDSRAVDVRVQVTAFDDPDWPFSDTVFITTKASPDDVQAWFPESLAPDDCWEGFAEDQVYEPYEIPAGYRLITCWWD